MVQRGAADARRAGMLGVAGALAATLLVVVLAAWAADTGPEALFRGEGYPRAEPVPTTTTATPTPTRPSQIRKGAEQRPAEPPKWLVVLGRLLEIGFLVALAYLVLRLLGWLRLRWRDRTPRPPPPAEVEFEVLDPPRAAAEAMVRDAPAQLDLLHEGTPRNGIVACWHRFEVQAAEAGVGRRPWETSSEFTLRLLDLVSADHTAVSALARLYREARFSDHAIGEDARGEARAALAQVHDELTRRFRHPLLQAGGGDRGAR